MQSQKISPVLMFVFVLIFVLSACSTSAPGPASTSTPHLTSTSTPVPTVTPRPSFTPGPTTTPRPTRTPNLAATERMDDLNAEAKSYFDLGYPSSADGEFKVYDDFTEDWAKIDYYQWWNLDKKASNFYMSAHFNWSTALQNSNESGCGFVFSIQENNDHYAVFLDRTNIVFLMSDKSLGYSRDVGKTRGTGRVKFDNPAEADFVLIVKDAYAYVLVNGEVVGEYTLSQSRSLDGRLALSVLSGTNKDYGTRCEMTNLHLWVPNQ